MLADLGIARLDRTFRHALEVEILWTANSLRIGEGLGQIRLGEAEKLRVVEIAKRRLTFS